jgi:hypothetical protein
MATCLIRFLSMKTRRVMSLPSRRGGAERMPMLYGGNTKTPKRSVG